MLLLYYGMLSTEIDILIKKCVVFVLDNFNGIFLCNNNMGCLLCSPCIHVHVLYLPVAIVQCASRPVF